MRLDQFIRQRIPRLSRTRAQAVVRECGYFEDGRRRRPSDIVRAGETVLLVRERFEEPDVPLHFAVVHDDGVVLGLDKPPGLPMHRTASYHRHTLAYLLREHYAGQERFIPRMAHRLDRETSGLVICALSGSAERTLMRAFEEHRVQKTYHAIVRGVPASRTGSITFPMAPVREGLHVLMEVRPDGLVSHTDYEVLGERGGHALLALFPRTGRQHQLRVHLAALGHPIVGDKLYGPDAERPFLEVIENGLTPALLESLGHPRQALHALSAELVHPETQRPLRLVAPFASDLAELWGRL